MAHNDLVTIPVSLSQATGVLAKLKSPKKEVYHDEKTDVYLPGK